MSEFTHYWSQDTVEWHRGSFSGHHLVHTAGNRLGRVEKGDVVYVISVDDGDVVLIGRMLVDCCGSEDKVARFLKNNGLMEEASTGEGLWEATHHLASLRENASRIDFSRRVPFARVRESLTFCDANDMIVQVKLTPDGKLDRQTLRGCRRLSAEGGALLREHL